MNSDVNFSIYSCKKTFPVVESLAQCCGPRDSNKFIGGIIKK